MELQVMMDATTEPLTGTLWPGHSPSPPYQRLSPPVRHEERDVITAQQVSMGYHVADAGLLQWNEKRESPKNSPDASHQLHSNGRSRENPSTSEQTSYNQSTNGLKRRSAEANQAAGELDRKHARRDGSVGSNGSIHWTTRQDEEWSAVLEGFVGNEFNVASYNMSEALLSPSTVFKQEALSPENQADNPNLNHVTQRNHNGPHQNTGNMVLPAEPDSNNNNSNISSPKTPNGAVPKTYNNGASSAANTVRNGANGERGQAASGFHQVPYPVNEEYPSSSSAGNHVSSTQGETEQSLRFQYVLAAATSCATKYNEETQAYLNQGQSYEIKLKKIGDLSPYRDRKLKSIIRITFHDKRLQFDESQQMLEWQHNHPGQRLLEVDIPLSCNMDDLYQYETPYKNCFEFTWDPVKEVGVYIKVNSISTEFTERGHGGEKGAPFRIQVETRLPDGQRLHAASCKIKVFKLKGAGRKHQQEKLRIQKKPPSEQALYQPSYECTVLVGVPLGSLTPPSPGSQNEGSPYALADAISPRSLDNVGAASPAALSAGPSVPLALEQSIQEDLNRSSLSVAGLNPPAILPNQSDSTTSTETLKLATDANEHQTSAWLRLNGFQAFANNFLGFSATDMFRLSREDLIEMCGMFHGIRLFNALRKPAMLTLYFAIEGAATPLWQVALLHNLTSGAFTSELLATMNLSNDRLHSVLFQGPHGTHIPLCDKFVANIKDESMYLVEIIRDPSNERFKLLLKRFPC